MPTKSIKVRFRCEECDEILRGLPGCEGRCPSCDTYQEAPEESYDPGEDAADRWAESQVGL